MPLSLTFVLNIWLNSIGVLFQLGVPTKFINAINLKVIKGQSVATNNNKALLS